MPIRRDLLHPETLQSFILAAEERYLDSAELLARGRTTASVYLAGFVVEMLLKHAAFRLRGALPGAQIGPLIGPALKWAKTFLPKVDPEARHSLWFWAQFVRGLRRELGRPLAPEFGDDFLRRAQRLHGNWAVNLRYCEAHAEIRDAKEAFEDMEWIRRHNTSLWR